MPWKAIMLSMEEMCCQTEKIIKCWVSTQEKIGGRLEWEYLIQMEGIWHLNPFVDVALYKMHTFTHPDGQMTVAAEMAPT